MEGPCFGHRERVVCRTGAILLLHRIGLVPLELVERSLLRTKGVVEPYQREIGIDPGLGGRAGDLENAIPLDDKLSLHLRLLALGVQNQHGKRWKGRSQLTEVFINLVGLRIAWIDDDAGQIIFLGAADNFCGLANRNLGIDAIALPASCSDKRFRIPGNHHFPDSH